MTKAEAVVFSILGAVRLDIRPFACAIEAIEHLLFVQNIPMDSIKLSRDVYQAVGEKLGKSTIAVARQVVRIGNMCWDAIYPSRVVQYIGHTISDIRAPSDMLFYLAFLVHFDKPFYQVISEKPAILF